MALKWTGLSRDLFGRASLREGTCYKGWRKSTRWRQEANTTVRSSHVFTDAVEGLHLKLLYEDRWLLAVDKPGAMLVHSSKEASIKERDQRIFVKDIAEQRFMAGRPLYPVHRLDRPASGVLILAKSGHYAHLLQKCLSSPACRKQYVVLARGCTPQKFVCDEPVKDEKGMPRKARTECTKLLDLPQARCSLLEVIIRTGRWHQIRKHLNHRGHHVVGDSAHGKGGTNRIFRERYQLPSSRCFLHAQLLDLPHPLRFLSHLPPTSPQEDDFLLEEDIPPTSSPFSPFGSGFGLSSTRTDMYSRSDGEPAPKQEQNVVRNLVLESEGCRAVSGRERDGSAAEAASETLKILSPLPDDLKAVLLAIPDGLELSTMKEFCFW